MKLNNYEIITTEGEKYTVQASWISNDSDIVYFHIDKSLSSSLVGIVPLLNVVSVHIIIRIPQEDKELIVAE